MNRTAPHVRPFRDQDFDWYRDRGITIESCLNVTADPAKRAYQQRLYGEVYD